MRQSLADELNFIRLKHLLRMDAAPGDITWITANGSHIPLGAGGTAVGGPLKGENFSNAKSDPKGGSGESSGGSSGSSSSGSGSNHTGLSSAQASSNNDKLSQAVKDGSYEETGKQMLKDAPAGTQVERFGNAFTKKPDGTWTSEADGDLTQADAEYLIVGDQLSASMGDTYLPKFKSSETKASPAEADTPKAPEGPDVGKAISDYQNYGYDLVNRGLREGTPLTGEAKEIDDGLQKGFEDAKPLEHNKTVYRDSGMAVTAEAFDKTGAGKIIADKLGTKDGNLQDLVNDPETFDKVKKALVGYEFTDDGYTSTTTSRKSLRDFSEGASNEDYLSQYGAKETLAISLKKGDKVLDLGKDGFIAGSGENETILNKGGHYKITDVGYDPETSSLRISCDYTPGGSGGGSKAFETYKAEHPHTKMTEAEFKQRNK